jgi:hypothetical protein
MSGSETKTIVDKISINDISNAISHNNISSKSINAKMMEDSNSSQTSETQLEIGEHYVVKRTDNTWRKMI